MFFYLMCFNKNILQKRNKQVKECQTFTIEKNQTFSKLLGEVDFPERKFEEMHYL